MIWGLRLIQTLINPVISGSSPVSKYSTFTLKSSLEKDNHCNLKDPDPFRIDHHIQSIVTFLRLVPSAPAGNV
jgi:hypothetical protein